jgi:riboflavin synthase
MFTGIITHLGKVKEKGNFRLTVESDRELLKNLVKGTSISVNGICLTVVSPEKNSFTIDYMPETAKKTNIDSLGSSDLVNLELSATPQTFLAGHIVQGHVDGVGNIAEIKIEKNSKIFRIKIPKQLLKYLVPKGSIAVNGISLTVIDVDENSFTVGIIPHTWEKTMLHRSKTGDLVNIEVDVLAKYIEKLITSASDYQESNVGKIRE